MPQRAVIYTRVSQDKTGRERSVTEQERELRLFAEDEGWTVDAVFTDNDRSASRYATKDRPGLVELEQYLRTHPVYVLAIWEASRLARSMSVAIYFRELCRELGIKVWYGEKLYDMENADDQKHFTDDMADAEHESAKSSKRIRRSVRSRAAAGLPHGKAQFGYVRVYGPSRELVEVVEEPAQAALLREMASRALDGESCYAIALDLRDRGIAGPTGGQWYATNVSRLLKNPSYAGKRVLKGEIVGDAVWPPLFDEETWARLQVVMLDPSRSTTENRGVKRLLSGIMVCGVCGGRVGTAKQNGGVGKDDIRKTYRVYICHGKTPTASDPKPKRFCTARKVEWVEPWVETVVIEKLKSSDALAAFVRPNSETDLIALDKAIEDRQKRLDEFYESASRPDGISASALARVEGPLLAELEQFQAERRRLIAPLVLRNVDLSADIEKQWIDWPLQVRRTVISELFLVTMLPVARNRKNPRSFDSDSVTVELARRSA